MRQLSSVLIAVSVAPRNGGRSEYLTCYFPIRLWGWCSIPVCRVRSDNRKTHFFRHNQWISQIANENYHTFRSTEFPGTRKRSRFSNRMRSLANLGAVPRLGKRNREMKQRKDIPHLQGVGVPGLPGPATRTLPSSRYTVENGTWRRQGNRAANFFFLHCHFLFSPFLIFLLYKFKKGMPNV
jgi:hypothetical protein